ncbi:TetR/AcrR family transcriptional regulator [Aliifodinibius sp. S!AR15-10]|uniref:TetR/AcrR family transcriptional regulator n=1 Tax=Aliifodinibius sp. S!AR15-10 TaxID=2950437 RepID=UPI00285DABE3|nr:TetR/AcrR family transcriptional regulator [Aliifodinibius sp. S!AR15-10]MDR8393295.1 TetR/AcrR family transcriptional regulator [Aliifodinibius sp. S!AR15-10]
MNKKPTTTRTKIMDAAQSIILDHGFGGTTVDAIIEQAGVSKGAFFHYFSSKAELGKMLVQRYADEDAEHLEQTLVKAEGLSDDPLQQMLIFVKLFEQEIKSLEEPFPGCLFASYLQQSELFDHNILDIIRESMLLWRTRVLDKLQKIEQKYPPRRDVDLESLADMLMVIFEGSFVLSQSLNENKIIAQQLLNYHRYLQLLFSKD